MENGLFSAAERARSDTVTRLRDVRFRSATAIVLLAIVALAFSLRVVTYLDAPKPFDGAGLAAEQGEIARNIVDHGSWFTVNPAAFALVRHMQVEQNRLIDPQDVDFTRVDRASHPQPEVDQMPGLGLVLAGIWWLSGAQTYSPLQWLQLVLDSTMVLLVFWVGLRVSGRSWVGLLSAFLYAIWPGAIVVAKRPMLDTWAGFFTIICTAAFVWARDAPSRRRRLVLLGAITGIAVYFRPFAILVPIALALAATPLPGWRNRIIWLALPLAVAIAVVAPWTIRNYAEFHRFIPTRTGLGQAVFEGSGRASSDEAAAAFVRKHARDAAYGSPKYDGYLLTNALHGIVDDPIGYLRLTGHRARYLLPCLLLLVVWRRRRTAAILVAAAAATIVPYIFVGDDTRFYLPAAFAYLILGAMAVETVIVSPPLRSIGRASRDRVLSTRAALYSRQR